MDEIVKFDPNQGTKFRTMFERAKKKSKLEGKKEGKKEANTLWTKKIKEAQSRGILDSKSVELLLSNPKVKG